MRLAAFILVCAAAFQSVAVTDVYEVRLHLHVPRVFDNTASAGYRAYQGQTIEARMRVTYEDGAEPTVYFERVENRTHKVGGFRVTYAPTEASGVVWHAIGSNRTGKFKRASVKCEVDLDPSYNIGDDEPDNALILTLSGNGRIAASGIVKSVGGRVAGQIGCGCRAYGHVSPTRVIGPNGATCEVVDIAAVHGWWSARWISRCP